MVVLHLMNSFWDSSISRIVVRLVRHLGPRNFRFHVGALEGSGDMQTEFARSGALAVDFSAGNRGMMNMAKRIREYVSAHGVDIIHTHTPRTILVAVLALGFRPRRPTHLATKHLLYSPGDRRWGLAYSLMDRVLLYAPNLLIPVSGKAREQITACPGLKRRAMMIRNAVDTGAFYVPDQRNACRLEFGLPPESVVLGSSGRIEIVKRYDLLLRAFSSVHGQHPETRLIIAGDGTLRPILEALANELGIAEAVIWTGFRKDVPRLLAAMDIYVNSSVNEGLSLSILEAMAAGKPVIITDVGGAREVVEHGDTGLLIPPGSADVIAKSIMVMLEDPSETTRIAAAGRKSVLREFGLERMLEGYGKIYETLVEHLPKRKMC
jgi:glycosyltransferase involved in cell wall biosynthesis